MTTADAQSSTEQTWGRGTLPLRIYIIFSQLIPSFILEFLFVGVRIGGSLTVLTLLKLNLLPVSVLLTRT